MVQGSSPAQLAQYRATAQRRQTAHAQQQSQRQRQGWEVARQAARVLKQEFEVQRVWLFGSMLEAWWVRPESDVDLLVMGLADDRYLEAVAHLLDLPELAVDMMQVEHAKPRLREVIEQQGVGAMSRYAVLVGEINHSLTDLEQLVAQTQALMAKVQATGDADYLGTVVLNGETLLMAANGGTP